MHDQTHKYTQRKTHKHFKKQTNIKKEKHRFPYLQGSKHHHFLLGALDFLQQDGPLGLFVELVDPDGIILQAGKHEGVWFKDTALIKV